MSVVWKRESETLVNETLVVAFMVKRNPRSLDMVREQMSRRRFVEGEVEPCGCTSAAWKRESESLDDCFHGKTEP
jgi:hypothetical protein